MKMSEFDQEKDLTSMKVTELRQILKSRGLTTKGRKQDLIDRIQFEIDSRNATNEKIHQNIGVHFPNVTPSCAKTTSKFDHGNCSSGSEMYCNDNDDLTERDCSVEMADGDKYGFFGLMEKFQKMVPLIMNCCEEIKTFHAVTTAYEQRIAQLELKNAQLEQMVSEIVKGSLDYENERSKVIVYGVTKDEFDAVDEFAINFVQNYLPNYEESDVTARTIGSYNQDNSVMISLACSADAFKLTKKCRAKGFTKVRQGLTRPERMMSKSVTLKTTQLNVNKTSDKTYQKRHLYKIAKIKKDEPRKPLDVFLPEFNLTNLGGMVTFSVSNMIRKTSIDYGQAAKSEQRPKNKKRLSELLLE